MNVLLPGLIGLAVGLLLGFAWRAWRDKGQRVLTEFADQGSDNLPVHLGNRYFRGINYLLNEQPDKALEVFLQLADVTPDTVDTHLALGSLFRRRGEMDNAIRCHQNIIDNQDLSAKTRQAATLELGEDYLRAGLLDRAEELFASLADQKILTTVALQRLLEIFQQEREWQHAIEAAKQHEKISGQSNQRLIAHFYCQLADEQRSAGDLQQAEHLLDKAQKADNSCARISIIRAQMSADQGQADDVIRYYRQAIATDADCFPLIIDDLVEAYRTTDQGSEAIAMLRQWLQEHSNTSAVIQLLRLCEESGDVELIPEMLHAQMLEQPTVGKMHALLKLRANNPGDDPDQIVTMFGPFLQRLQERRDGYQCRICGLSGHTHHWQCPSCRHWDTTVPVSGILGE